MSRINNSFRFTGNLGTDPEIRYNPNNGAPIARIPLAVDASYKNRETGPGARPHAQTGLGFKNPQGRRRAANQGKSLSSSS